MLIEADKDRKKVPGPKRASFFVQLQYDSPTDIEQRYKSEIPYRIYICSPRRVMTGTRKIAENSETSPSGPGLLLVFYPRQGFVCIVPGVNHTFYGMNVLKSGGVTKIL